MVHAKLREDIKIIFREIIGKKKIKIYMLVKRQAEYMLEDILLKFPFPEFEYFL